jgi:multidrug efflux system outer membrane protein
MKWLAAATLGAGMCLAGCAVGPKYQRPPIQSPPAWKSEGPWREAAPKDAFPKGAWWEIFHDDELNGYEQQLLQANQSIAAARDRLDQARSLARVASAGLFPTLSADPSASRNRYSGNRPQGSIPAAPLTQGLYQIPFALNYEVDLFGRARKTLEAANASLQGTAADLQNVQLVLTAELAADYFSLRELDSEYHVVEESVQIQQRGLALVKHRHEGGIASGLDLAQQQTLLDSTVTQLYLLQQQRAQFEHAMAVLTGNAASTFSVRVAPLLIVPPPIPLGIPSDLLERRPDVATAERALAQANALVGVAKTSFYPQFTISGSGGFQSISLGSIISAPSAFWSLGGDLLQPIFNGGRNRATFAATKSAYDESVANYRERGRRRRASCARHRQRSLCWRADNLPRCHHCAIRTVDERAALDPVAGTADGHLGFPGQSIGRRLGCVNHSERASAPRGDPGAPAVKPRTKHGACHK